LDMQHGHGHAAWNGQVARISPHSMYWDMQHGHGHTAWTWAHIIDMDIRDRHGHSA
jgi:hypothetical protein